LNCPSKSHFTAQSVIALTTCTRASRGILLSNTKQLLLSTFISAVSATKYLSQERNLAGTPVPTTLWKNQRRQLVEKEAICDESFATIRGQAQHERNRHPIRLSKLLANLASQPEEDEDTENSEINKDSQGSQPTHWPLHQTNPLIREMFNIGCSSDIALAKAMGIEKTAHQVGKVKRRILSQYPDWRETFSYVP